MTQVRNSASFAVDTYLTAFYSGDFAAASSVVADEFIFVGPFIKTQSKKSFFDGAEALRAIVRGHCTLRQWVDGDEVCTVYDVTLETPLGSGIVSMSEWHNVREGQLVTGRVFFDSAAFRAFVPARS